LLATLLSLLLATMLLSTEASSSCNTSAACRFWNQNFECESGDLTIWETGNMNVPKYSFWSTKNSSNQYKFQLGRLYEATPTSDGQLKMVGGSNIAFASLDWIFSVPTVVQTNSTNNDCDEETRFNITNDGDDKKARWDSLVIVNHIRNEDAFGIKFDVVLTNYVWSQGSSDNTSVLVLEIQLNGEGNDQLQYVNNTIRLGDLFFNSTDSAQSTIPGQAATDVAVTLSLDGGNTVQIVYAHFPAGSSLVHDPLVGLQSLVESPSHVPIGLIIGLTLGIAVFLVVVVVVALGLFVRHRNKSRAYQNI